MRMRWVALVAVGLAAGSALVRPGHVWAQDGQVLWSRAIGGEIWAPLSHHDGKLYVGSDDSTFYAVDLEARDIAWAFPTGGMVRSGAAIADGMVLFASDDGYLYALESESGSEVWRFDLGSGDKERVLPATDPPYEYDYLHSTPAHHDGLVFVGSADGALYAVRLESGTEDWRFETAGKIRSTPAVAGGRVYFGSWDGHVYALEAESGEEAWRFDTGGVVQGSPALDGGRLFVGSRAAAVYSLDAGSGDLLWTHGHSDGSWVESSPMPGDGAVYIGSSDARALFALDAASGRTLWRFETGGWSWSTPTISPDVVYIGGISAAPYYVPGVTLEAGFHAVDRASGRRIWHFEPEPIEGYITGGVFSTAVAADGIVYVAGLDGRVYAFRE